MEAKDPRTKPQRKSNGAAVGRRRPTHSLPVSPISQEFPAGGTVTINQPGLPVNQKGLRKSVMAGSIGVFFHLF